MKTVKTINNLRINHDTRVGKFLVVSPDNVRLKEFKIQSAAERWASKTLDFIVLATPQHHFNFEFDNPRPDLVTVLHGRRGTLTEYVEFAPYNSRVKFVAQLSYSEPHGCSVMAYRVESGRNGKVKTLVAHHSPRMAIQRAYEEALKVAQG